MKELTICVVVEVSSFAEKYAGLFTKKINYNLPNLLPNLKSVPFAKDEGLCHQTFIILELLPLIQPKPAEAVLEKDIL